MSRLLGVRGCVLTMVFRLVVLAVGRRSEGATGCRLDWLAPKNRTFEQGRSLLVRGPLEAGCEQPGVVLVVGGGETAAVHLDNIATAGAKRSLRQCRGFGKCLLERTLLVLRDLDRLGDDLHDERPFHTLGVGTVDVNGVTWPQCAEFDEHAFDVVQSGVRPELRDGAVFDGSGARLGSLDAVLVTGPPARLSEVGRDTVVGLPLTVDRVARDDRWHWDDRGVNLDLRDAQSIWREWMHETRWLRD